MMLSIVSWKGLGGGGAGRVCAGISCGKINDKTQNTMPARRRFFVFIVVSREAEHLSAFRFLFAPLREIPRHKSVSRKGAKEVKRRREKPDALRSRRIV
jgi:hypothetical protein